MDIIIRVAVLGPQDLVERVVALGSSFSSFVLVPYPYQSERETVTILEECAADNQIVLFTGPIPYAIARVDCRFSLPMFYVAYSSGALYGVLLSHIEAFGRRKGDPMRMSVDTLDASTVYTLLEEFSSTQPAVYAMEEQQQPITEEALVAHHYGLYRQGNTDFAITGLTSAYRRLCALGVPAYRLMITDGAIRAALSLVENEAKTIIQHDEELCVGTVQVINGASVRSNIPSDYENRRLRLMLMTHMVDFFEEIKASMRIDDDDTYVFFTNRGAIDTEMQGYRAMQLIERTQKILPFDLCIGLGYGHSVYAAEQNSKKALQQAIHWGKNSCTSMAANGSLTHLYPVDAPITYTSRTDEPWVLDLSDRSGVSVSTITKIAGSIANQGYGTFTAKDIAEVLGITLRSARRILEKLEEAKGAVAVGKEQPAGSGRPRRIYRFIAP